MSSTWRKDRKCDRLPKDISHCWDRLWLKLHTPALVSPNPRHTPPLTNVKPRLLQSRKPAQESLVLPEGKLAGRKIPEGQKGSLGSLWLRSSPRLGRFSSLQRDQQSKLVFSTQQDQRQLGSPHMQTGMEEERDKGKPSSPFPLQKHAVPHWCHHGLTTVSSLRRATTAKPSGIPSI